MTTPIPAANELGTTRSVRPVQIAILGLNFGRHIVDDLSKGLDEKSCMQLVAVCDMDAAKATRVAAGAGVRALTSLDELLADDSIEAVGLFTGPVNRAGLIRTIIRAGKDVITTKPFELNAAAAADVLEEAARLKRVVHINSPSPLMSGDLKQVLKWQEKYALGRPIACRREVWVSYREQADGSWYDDPKLCPVAPIFRLGIYLINDAVRLFGEPDAVQVFQSRLLTGRPTADNAQLNIRFKNGVLVSIFASFCVDDGQFYSNTMTLNYERGTIYRNAGPSAFGVATKLPKMSVVAKSAERETVIEHATPEDNSGKYQWQAFHDAVRGIPLADTISTQEIVAGVRILQAMARAEASGNTEPVV